MCCVAAFVLLIYSSSDLATFLVSHLSLVPRPSHTAFFSQPWKKAVWEGLGTRLLSPPVLHCRKRQEAESESLGAMLLSDPRSFDLIMALTGLVPRSSHPSRRESLGTRLGSECIIFLEVQRQKQLVG